MERNKFLVFCFAFVPGAGQMYLGMMKKGLVIMGAFWAVIAIAVMLNLGVLFVFLPIIWYLQQRPLPCRSAPTDGLQILGGFETGRLDAEGRR